jgi:hypothetical protein
MSNSLAIIPDKPTLPAVTGSDSGFAEAGELGGFSSSFLNALTFGHIGKAVTFAINKSGYSRNPSALKQIYQKHPNAIDAYFNQINTDKIVKDVIGGKKSSITHIIVPSLLGGILLGVGGMIWYNRSSRQ